MDYMQIQLRNDEAAAWAGANPVLARGELGVEIDTFKVKMGDGVLPWNDLPYLRGTGTGGTEVDWGDIIGSIASNAALTEALAGKVDVVPGKGLSTEDYTAEEKEKLAGLDLSGYQEKDEKGQPNGYAPLGDDGMLPASMYVQGGDGEMYLETAFRVAGVSGASITVDPSVVNGVAAGSVVAVGDTIKVAGEKYTVLGVSTAGTATTIALEEAPAGSAIGEPIRVMARGNVVPLASEVTPGLVKKATAAEVAAGTDDTAFVSPLLLPRGFGRIRVGGSVLQADALNALFELEAGDGVNLSLDVAGKKIKISAGSNVNPDVDAALSTWTPVSSGTLYAFWDTHYSDYHNLPLLIAQSSTTVGATRLFSGRDGTQLSVLISLTGTLSVNKNTGWGLSGSTGTSSNSYLYSPSFANSRPSAIPGGSSGLCFAYNVNKWVSVSQSVASTAFSFSPYTESATPAWTPISAPMGGWHDCEYLPWLGLVLACGDSRGALIDPDAMGVTMLTVPSGPWGKVIVDEVKHRVILSPNKAKISTACKDFCWSDDLTNWHLVSNLYEINLGDYSPQMDALVFKVVDQRTSVGVSYGMAPIVLKSITGATTNSSQYSGTIYDKTMRNFVVGGGTGSVNVMALYSSLPYNP